MSKSFKNLKFNYSKVEKLVNSLFLLFLITLCNIISVNQVKAVQNLKQEAMNEKISNETIEQSKEKVNLEENKEVKPIEFIETADLNKNTVLNSKTKIASDLANGLSHKMKEATEFVQSTLNTENKESSLIEMKTNTINKMFSGMQKRFEEDNEKYHVFAQVDSNSRLGTQTNLFSHMFNKSENSNANQATQKKNLRNNNKMKLSSNAGTNLLQVKQEVTSPIGSESTPQHDASLQKLTPKEFIENEKIRYHDEKEKATKIMEEINNRKKISKEQEENKAEIKENKENNNNQIESTQPKPENEDSTTNSNSNYTPSFQTKCSDYIKEHFGRLSDNSLSDSIDFDEDSDEEFNMYVNDCEKSIEDIKEGLKKIKKIIEKQNSKLEAEIEEFNTQFPPTLGEKVSDAYFTLNHFKKFLLFNILSKLGFVSEDAPKAIKDGYLKEYEDSIFKHRRLDALLRVSIENFLINDEIKNTPYTVNNENKLRSKVSILDTPFDDMIKNPDYLKWEKNFISQNPEFDLTEESLRVRLSNMIPSLVGDLRLKLKNSPQTIFN